MYPFHPYFEYNGRPGVARILSEDHGEVTFRKLKPARAHKLWLAGFSYLAITREGAKHFLTDTTEAERIQLMAVCKTGNEVEAVLKVSTAHAGLKKAAAERMAELGLEPASAEPKEARTSTRKRR